MNTVTDSEKDEKKEEIKHNAENNSLSEDIERNRLWKEDFEKRFDMIQKEESKYYSFVSVGFWSNSFDNPSLIKGIFRSTKGIFSSTNHPSTADTYTYPCVMKDKHDVRFIEKCKQWKELFNNKTII